MKKIELNKEELDNILKMYNEELLGSQTISEKTGISKPTILRILKENGVVMGPSGRRFIGGKKIADKKWRDNNKEKLSKLLGIIKERGLVTSFNEMLEKTDELKNTFLSFVDSLKVTGHKMSGMLAYTFIIPFLSKLIIKYLCLSIYSNAII